MTCFKADHAVGVRTPKHNFKIGELVKTEKGEWALRIKKGKDYEIITISELISIFLSAILTFMTSRISG